MATALMLLRSRGATAARRHLIACAAAARTTITPGGAAAPLSTAAVPFYYQELFDLGKDTETPYRKLTSDHVSTFKVRVARFGEDDGCVGMGRRAGGCVCVSLHDHSIHLDRSINKPTIRAHNIHTLIQAGGHEFLKVEPEALRLLSSQAMVRVSVYTFSLPLVGQGGRARTRPPFS
jgi:hypothetical protein